jgi:hypothetical protein
MVHCLLVSCDPSRRPRRRRGAGSEGYVESVSYPSVEITVIDGDRVGVEKTLAFYVGICLACHQAPFPDVIPVMTRLSTFLDNIVDRSQYAVWPNKCQDFTLVSAGGRRDGVIHPGGVNHGDMCLTPEHGQIHLELLNIYPIEELYWR